MDVVGLVRKLNKKKGLNKLQFLSVGVRMRDSLRRRRSINFHIIELALSV